MAERKKRPKRGRTGASKRQRVRDNAFNAMRGALGTTINAARGQDRELQRQIDELNERLPNMLPRPVNPKRKQGI